MATTTTTAMAALSQKMGSKYIIPVFYIKISALYERKKRAFIARVVCLIHAARAFLFDYHYVFGRRDNFHSFAFNSRNDDKQRRDYHQPNIVHFFTDLLK